jgi:hypothetical protein
MSAQAARPLAPTRRNRDNQSRRNRTGGNGSDASCFAVLMHARTWLEIVLEVELVRTLHEVVRGNELNRRRSALAVSASARSWTAARAISASRLCPSTGRTARAGSVHSCAASRACSGRRYGPESIRRERRRSTRTPLRRASSASAHAAGRGSVPQARRPATTSRQLRSGTSCGSSSRVKHVRGARRAAPAAPPAPHYGRSSTAGSCSSTSRSSRATR